MTSSAPAPARWWVRLLVATAIAGAVGATWGFTSSSTAPAPVLSASDATASVVPDTIAPMTETSATTPTTAISIDETVTTSAEAPPHRSAPPTSSTPPTTALSPLAELLGPSGSAIPPNISPRVQPVALSIDDIDVDGPVRPVGLEEDGQLEIPDETEIGWYFYGAAPGHTGATVLAAHVSWNRTTGPFFRLGELEPGARVRVGLDDGSQRTYEVTERTMYDKDSLPRERIWRNTGPETLVLITCGGDFNPDIRRYRQNIVVYAVPVDQTQDVG